MSKDLFAFHGENVLKDNAPLAERMRPKSLDDFVGQTAILSEGRLLRRAIAADRVGNLLLYGPPGVGKTTLARIIARNTRSYFSVLNAALVGIKELRQEILDAKQRLNEFGLRTILFIDEVHRFNTSQQDALLFWIENGTLTLIGATTENPYFEVNKALVSRSRIFRLQHLDNSDLHKLLQRALKDCEYGYGKRLVKLSEEAANHLVDVANGDARSLLNALELAVETTTPDGNELIEIDLAIAEESIQQRAVLYDKEGDAHFDTISAFIKSLRGSDPDAALFWLARMVEAGENPKFIFRRMLIAASEDIGLADPQAIVVVQACSSAFDRIGLPEGLYLLAQAAIYLAATEKSNSVIGFFDAIKSVKESQSYHIPTHLRDSHRDKETFGDGMDYSYPHSFSDNWIAQQYLPAELNGTVFWNPTQHGWEGLRRLLILERRAAQFEALGDFIDENPLLLNTGVHLNSLDGWIQRQFEDGGNRLQILLKKLWSDVKWKRNDRALIIGSRPLFWAVTPMRQVPEGGVSLITSSEEEVRISDLLDFLDPILRPTLITNECFASNNLPTNLKFEWIGGRVTDQFLSDKDKYSFWERITLSSHSNTELRLLISNPLLGPLESLLGVSNKKQVSNSKYFQKIISLEHKLLNNKIFLDSLFTILSDLGWKTEIETWEEDLFFIIDDKLENRWLAENSRYRRLLSENLNINDVSIILDLMKKISGSKITQKIIHTKVIGHL